MRVLRHSHRGRGGDQCIHARRDRGGLLVLAVLVAGIVLSRS